MAWVLTLIAVVLMVGIAAYLVTMLFRSIRQERRRSRLQKIWANFGLSIGFAALFFLSWIGQGLVEWQRYRDEAETHRQPVEAREFLTEFSQSTLENWQSEFLQLFSFVVMAAVFIHKGSAESKDGEEEIQAALKRIEEKLGTTPGS